MNAVVEQFNNKILNDPQWGIVKEGGFPLDRPISSSKMKMPVISRVSSAKNVSRPDSALSRLTVFTHNSARPTTANTNSRISINAKSFFGVK